MAKGSAQSIARFDIGAETERDFNIFFNARNSFVTQLLRLRKINNQWVYATKVIRDNKNLFEKIDDNFPKSNDGTISW
jgi:hypothetical protein